MSHQYLCLFIRCFTGQVSCSIYKYCAQCYFIDVFLPRFLPVQLRMQTCHQCIFSPSKPFVQTLLSRLVSCLLRQQRNRIPISIIVILCVQWVLRVLYRTDILVFVLRIWTLVVYPTILMLAWRFLLAIERLLLLWVLHLLVCETRHRTLTLSCCWERQHLVRWLLSDLAFCEREEVCDERLSQEARVNQVNDRMRIGGNLVNAKSFCDLCCTKLEINLHTKTN